MIGQKDSNKLRIIQVKSTSSIYFLAYVFELDFKTLFLFLF
jgi:hypothetical protein